MTLEEAIHHAEEKAKRGGECGEDHAQLAMWLKELQERRAAESEERNGKSVQNVPKEDLISRRAAIDALIRKIRPHNNGDGTITMCVMSEELVRKTLDDLPSAQPEIIYCKKCEHWTRTYGDEQWGLGDCDVFDKHLVRCNGYCAWAERRRDG